MIAIGDILVSDELIEEQFVCNLTACKGACCWEGEYGAPLDPAELDVLERIYPDVAPYLSPAGRAAIAAQGTAVYEKANRNFATPLVDGGPCAYMTLDSRGVAQCGIERAYRDGVIDYRKPVSCHLYPIRVKRSPHADYEALNYDRWDICAAACTQGRREKVAVYEFAKEALIRAYGPEFYAELDQAAQHLKD